MSRLMEKKEKKKTPLLSSRKLKLNKRMQYIEYKRRYAKKKRIYSGLDSKKTIRKLYNKRISKNCILKTLYIDNIIS